MRDKNFILQIMENREFIERKLDAILRYAKHLDSVLGFSDEEIGADFLKLHALERIIQLIVDEIVDINTHIIRRSTIETPDDFQGSFVALARGGILPEEFARKIAPTVGLRNRLVHRYEEIDPALLIHMARAEKDDFGTYVKHINAFLQNSARK